MITNLYKYPIKGLTGVQLTMLNLVAHEGLSGDRAIAIARKADTFNPDAPRAIPKTKFLMLARDEALAQLQTRYDETSDELIIQKDGATLLAASVASVEGRQEIEAFFSSYLAKDGLQPNIVRADGHKFTDISVVSPEKMRAISLINLASVRALSDAIGKPVDLRRFRANIYFDTGTPWEELDWIDQNLSIGSVKAKCVMRTKRCPATEVNPETGTRDIQLPLELSKHFGHTDMGIYAEIQTTGDVRIGDPVGTV